MEKLYGNNIVIVGLGLTGISCVDFFLTRGVIPRVMDDSHTPLGVNKLPKKIERYLGGLNEQWLLEADLVVVSPGISLLHPSLRTAVFSGIRIVGDIDLFCLEAQAPIVAITGTNGKSTVTAMIGEMAKSVGCKVGIGGNIGVPVLTLLKQYHDLYILELSSFQLGLTNCLQSSVATVLNVTEDHINYYPYGFQQYCTTKLRIYENAKTCVVNLDDELTIPMNCTGRCYTSFGINSGDYHLDYQNNTTWICMKKKKILDVKQMKLSGKHNYTNALAAIAIADSIGLSRTSSLRALTEFVGLPHRFQIVLNRNGVRWINDSKSTNIGSTKAALNSLRIDGTLHLLLGGDGKSTDFSSLRPYLMGDNIRIYCFGKDRNILTRLRPEITEQTETMEESIYLLAPHVTPGDIVLLSPACSSLDQFKNFEKRGDVFTRLARKLG